MLHVAAGEVEGHTSCSRSDTATLKAGKVIERSEIAGAVRGGTWFSALTFFRFRIWSLLPEPPVPYSAAENQLVDPYFKLGSYVDVRQNRGKHLLSLITSLRLECKQSKRPERQQRETPPQDRWSC